MLSNIFCAKAAGPVELKFHIESLWVGRMKVCSNSLDHVSEMATMHVKNVEKSSPKSKG